MLRLRRQAAHRAGWLLIFELRPDAARTCGEVMLLSSTLEGAEPGLGPHGLVYKPRQEQKHLYVSHLQPQQPAEVEASRASRQPCQLQRFLLTCHVGERACPTTICVSSALLCQPC